MLFYVPLTTEPALRQIYLTQNMHMRSVLLAFHAHEHVSSSNTFPLFYVAETGIFRRILQTIQVVTTNEPYARAGA